MFRQFLNVIGLVSAAWLLTGCGSGDAEIKTYRVAYPKNVPGPAGDSAAPGLPPNHPTLNPDAPVAVPDAAADESHWTWTVPEGWTEQAGGGFRMASFAVPGEGMDCSIVALGVSAGGIGANVNRWRGQVGLESVAEEEIIRSLKIAKTDDGHEALICDLKGEEQTIRAAIIRTDHETVFIKLTGPGPGVEAQATAFNNLVTSFRHK